ARLIFTETELVLPDEAIPYEELLYRKADTIKLHAATLELVDRCYKDVPVRLTQDTLQIGQERLNPIDVVHMEVQTSKIVLPQEAMGLGDVKFMGAIGAFLGWKAVIFTLVASSFIGGFLVGIPLVLMGKRGLSSKLPYGPYLAA